MVALRSAQRAKLHYGPMIGRTKFWTMVALWSDQKAKSHYSFFIERMRSVFEQNVAVVSEKFRSPVKNRLFEIFQYNLCFLPTSFFIPGLGPAMAELHKKTIEELRNLAEHKVKTNLAQNALSKIIQIETKLIKHTHTDKNS